MNRNTISSRQAMFAIFFLFVVAIACFQYLKFKRTENIAHADSPEKTMEGINLIGMDNQRLESATLSKGIYLLLCFKDDCASCNPCLISWRNLVQFFGNRVKAVGIMPYANPGTLQIQTDKISDFLVYTPEDNPSFLRQLGINSTTENTIIVYNNKILAHKMGRLSGRDLKSLIAIVKQVLKNQ